MAIETERGLDTREVAERDLEHGMSGHEQSSHSNVREHSTVATPRIYCLQMMGKERVVMKRQVLQFLRRWAKLA